MMLPSAVVALALASPFANAQRFKPSPDGCLLDQTEDVVAKINCGRKSAVNFAVEWYGANMEELQSWLEVAGCSEIEAEAEARWAVVRCQGSNCCDKTQTLNYDDIYPKTLDNSRPSTT